MGLFQRRASVDTNKHGAAASVATGAAPEAEPQALAQEIPAIAVTPPQPDAVAAAPAPPPVADPLPFDVADFPRLPLGTALWADAVANVVNLEGVVPHLPNSLLVLTGPTCQAAALVTDGAIVDAVWVSGDEGLLGDEAVRALVTADTGTLTAHSVDDSRLGSILPMLWRWPRLASGLPAAWVHTDDLVAEVRTSHRSCGLLVDSSDPGAALFDRGELVAVYTRAHPWPARSMAALRSLLHGPDARVTVIGEPPASNTAATDAEEQSTATEPEDSPTVAEAAEPAADGEEPSALSVTEEAPADVAGSDLIADENGVEAGEAAAAPDADAQDVAVVAAPDTVEDEPPIADGQNAEAVVAEPVESVDAAVATEADAGAAGHADNAEGAGDFAEAEAAPPSRDSAEPASQGLRFEPAIFSLASLALEAAEEPTEMQRVEAREATEFVPTRLDIDVDALRRELTDIAVVWLGAEDSAPVAAAIGSARAGVDDFVATIAAIGAMEIPGHDSGVVRAMAREMHFRASEVLCGV